MDDSQFVIPVAAAGTTAYVPGTTVRDNLAQEAANAKQAASKTVEIYENNKRSKKSSGKNRPDRNQDYVDLGDKMSAAFADGRKQNAEFVSLLKETIRERQRSTPNSHTNTNVDSPGTKKMKSMSRVREICNRLRELKQDLKDAKEIGDEDEINYLNESIESHKKWRLDLEKTIFD
jgi:hypothetical protein